MCAPLEAQLSQKKLNIVYSIAQCTSVTVLKYKIKNEMNFYGKHSQILEWVDAAHTISKKNNFFKLFYKPWIE